ncbi:sister chromatid cohesion C-terminus-domain-containing protein [Apodospora peruviana]|uniref:Sister chromatid cohesion protein n=1 Tax=Apodospora peruviana TaxID=516989 RepID=A0AAE0I4E2_9PEZI|nr:sister chromatid cohesion C-terminus-domain-containing protein [Apodospora peruviana]
MVTPGTRPSASHSSHSSHSSRPNPGFSRPFLLPEVLPYTPFTSIVPFDSTVLPAPSIGSASPAPTLRDLVPNHDFDALNQEGRTQGPPSKRIQHTLSQVQHLMERGNVTEYKFKTGPRKSDGSSSKRPLSLASDLAPFSKMVLDQSSVSFRYPTLDTPSSASPNGHLPTPVSAPALAPVPKPKPVSPVVQKAVHPKQTPNVQKNRQAHSHNSVRLEIVLPTKSQLEQANSEFKRSTRVATPIAKSEPSPPVTSHAEPQKPAKAPLVSPQPVNAVDNSITVTPVTTTPQAPSGPQRSEIAIELPRAAAFNRSEFLVVADDADEPFNLSARKRKIEDMDVEGTYGESLDLRQRAKAAFHELRMFLQGVFEAEDQALRSQSGSDSVILLGENETTLTAAAQTKAQTLLERTISRNCFQTVPLDDLLRLFRLSEGALKQAESLNIKIEESWNAADVDQWLQQLPVLEIALKAARTCLRMMCGGRQDKQLYSEGAIDKSLYLFKRVMDGIIIPIVELRSSDSSAELFRALSSQKRKITPLFTDCQKLFSLMSLLISKIDTSDTVSNTLEFTATRLIFMETAHAEKDSVIETQKFDGLRVVAMDMLSQIFLLNTAQRQGIFDEILTSLAKLPLGKRARTFKLIGGNNIQPVSALMMRLVQTTAGQVEDAKAAGGFKVLQSLEDGEDHDEEPVTGRRPNSFTIHDENHGASRHATAIQELIEATTPMKTARDNALYVVKYIVSRALKSTKTGDTPYRNLLDLFVEDFTTCLDNPDWPAAELFLRLLTGMMVQLMDDSKSSVTSKNMALELLGIIGAAISKLRGYVRKTATASDARDADDLGRFLADLASAALEMKSRPENMLAWTGPYRATLEYLERRFSEDRHLSSAISFIISDWGSRVCVAYDEFEDEFPERDQEFGRLAYRLREMIQDRRWLLNEYSFKEVSDSQGKLSYCILLLRSQLCESFRLILNKLLGSMASDQPTVRSKSLKSINQVLETDPSILDGDSVVVELILQCSNDSSPQVRDSALGLIGKCIGMRPGLEERMVRTVVARLNDANASVRKRAMKLAKDIYLRNSSNPVRSHIANGLLPRVQDPEESVRDLARLVMEEIWFAPFYNGENSAITQISLADHVALMVQTVKEGSVSNVLDKVLQTLFSSKTAQASLEVCKKLVASMFDLVDNPDSGDSSVPSGRDALPVLMIFAKAEPILFTFEQLRLLKPYITSIQSSEDLAVSRAVVVIYRTVLPQLSSAHAQFLTEVRKELMPAVKGVTRALLDDVMACLWIISTLVEDSEPIARLTVSGLRNIQVMAQKSKTEPLDNLKIRQFERYSLIVGMVGKHCDLDSQRELFKPAFPKWNGTGSISTLMVDVVLPLAAPSQPLDVRKAALDCIGLICQASPRNYVNVKVYTTFQQVFDSQTPILESMILRSFKEFLFTEEKRSEQASEAPTINSAKPTKTRELEKIGGTSYDDVASGTTQRFLKEIIRIATSAQDTHAFLAVEVLASINRQGLTHPKETGVTFITLETSSNPRISELAYLEHKALHGKHETVVEREYVKAIQSAFAYQRDIVKDPRGAICQRDIAKDTNHFTPKLYLMMEVLKISKTKNRQKFLEKFCTQVDFDVSKLELSEELPPHVQYSRFLLENIAFFEYLTVGEVHSTVSTLEKLVTSTGATVAQTIESEVFQVRMDTLDSTPNPNSAAGEVKPQVPSQPIRPEINMKRLRQLTAASMILLAVWEVRTHLRRLYNMGTGRRESKGKLLPKDLSKPPTKIPSVTGDKVWDDVAKAMTALESRERMIETCREFVDLMNVDKEYLVQDDEEMDDEDPTTPDNEEAYGLEEQHSGRGRKRKAPGSTPGKKKRPRSSSQPRKRGRPRKQSVEAQDAEGEFDEGDWF